MLIGQLTIVSAPENHYLIQKGRGPTPSPVWRCWTYSSKTSIDPTRIWKHVAWPIAWSLTFYSSKLNACSWLYCQVLASPRMLMGIWIFDDCVATRLKRKYSKWLLGLAYLSGPSVLLLAEIVVRPTRETPPAISATVWGHQHHCHII